MSDEGKPLHWESLMEYGTALDNLRYTALGRLVKGIAEEVPSVDDDSIMWRHRLVLELEWLVVLLAAGGDNTKGPTNQHRQPVGPAK